jgi:DNA-binding beta-propeller fold protein YncE
MRKKMAMCGLLFWISMTLLATDVSSKSPSPGSGSNSTLLVANQTDRTLSLINPVAGAQIVAVPEGGVTGHEVAASPDGRLAYVPIYGDSGVGKPGSDGRDMVVIDIASQKVVGTVDFGPGVRPHCVV